MREQAFLEKPMMHTRGIELGETVYEYYGHSGRAEVVNYRRLAEAWLSQYPEQHLQSFLRRFRGKDAHAHESAFFELFLHERLRVLCDELEVEGPIPDSGKRADFVLHYSDGSALAIEALSLGQVSFVTDANVDLVNEWLRQLTSRDFTIWFGETEGHLSSTPKKREVLDWARQVLSKYSWEKASALVQATGDRLIPVEPLRLGDWSASAELWVREPQHRTESECLGVLAGQTFEYYNVPMVLRERIEKKIRSKKVERSSTPFILAVNVIDRMLRPAEEELEILHGFKRRIRFTTTAPGAARPDVQAVFSPDGTEGIWSTSDNKARYGRCSAIWFFHRVGLLYPQGSRQALYLNSSIPPDTRLLALQRYATANGDVPD